jgi:hypothetical protein
MTRIAPARPAQRRSATSGRRRLRLASLMVLVATLALATAGPALSGTFVTRAKWKNCDTTKVGISVAGTFTDVATIHGTGRYMVKKEVRWDRLIGSGRWRASDVHSTETRWLTIRNPSYDFVSSIGDTTVWGATYPRRWRAHVTLKLVKNRPGPRDKKVDEIDISPTKGSFREVGSSCDGGVTPGRRGGGGRT